MVRELKPKEMEIINFLKNQEEEVYETTIAFAIRCNPYYAKFYLKELEKLGLTERIIVKFRSGCATRWKLKQRGENEKK